MGLLDLSPEQVSAAAPRKKKKENLSHSERKESTNSKDKHVFPPTRVENAVTLEENTQERSEVQKANDGEQRNRCREGGEEEEERRREIGGERGSAGKERTRSERANES